MSSAYAPAAPTAALAPSPSTARRLKSGMRVIMPGRLAKMAMQYHSGWHDGYS